jgi:hypothetical protein
MAVNCTKIEKCSVSGCEKSHHFLLHSVENGRKLWETKDSRENGTKREFRPNKQTSKIESTDKNTTTDEDATSVCDGNYATYVQGDVGRESDTVRNHVTKIALRTVPVFVSGNNGKTIKVNALLDDGSTTSYIDEKLASELNLEGEVVSRETELLGGHRIKLASMKTVISLNSVDGTVTRQLECWTQRNVVGKLDVIEWKEHQEKWSHLKNMPFA